jgi:hypothetical protein
VVRLVSRYYHHYPETVFLVQAVIGHLAAFVANESVDEPSIDLYESLKATRSPFVANAMMFLVPLGSVLFFTLCSHASSLSKRSLTDVSHEEIEEMDEVTEEAEDESSAITFGYLVKMVAVFLVGSNRSQETHTHAQVQHMWCITAILFVLLIVVGQSKHHISHRISEKLQTHSAMAFGWCAMTSAKWSAYESRMLSEPESVQRSFTVNKIGTAVGITVTSVFLIVLIDFMADRGFVQDEAAHEIVNCCGLTAGLAWEKAFASGILTSLRVFFDEAAESWVVSVIAVVMILIMLYASLLLIVPTARLPVPKRQIEEKELCKPSES